ncbi:hypothetical protein MMC27_003484 [Xylographa pallens]|nr:hypothetical protein [Xylographa pallens]
MHKTLIKLLFFAAGVAAAPAASTSACNEDNCLRAVQGSAFPTRHGSADCMSYFKTTVTPATSTSTVTVTATSKTTDVFTITDTGTTTATIPVTVIIPETATVTEALKKRFEMADLVRTPKASLAPRQMTVAPSSIPSYASACSGSVRYSSACSCIGVTATTSTAPTPTITTTVTVTTVQTSDVTQTSSATLVIDVSTTILDTLTVATVTVTQCAPIPTGDFTLSAVGGTFAGQYAQVVSSGDGGDDVIMFGPQSSASTFAIDAAGHMHVGNEYANTDAGTTSYVFYFSTPAQIAAQDFVYATCSVLPGNALSCVDQVATQFQTCPALSGSGSGLVIGNTILSGCTPLSFMATCF